MHVHAGTSGFSYKEWKGSFYPRKLKNDEMLAHYAGHLSTVEINNTFYRMPRSAVLQTWAGSVPDGFSFALKASKRITHGARIGPDSLNDLTYLLSKLGGLGDRLGPLLFQLPPWLKCDVDRLAQFLTALEGRRAAFEFRHSSWATEATDALLAQHAASRVLTDSDESPIEAMPAAADWGYLRLRRSSYPDAALESLRERLLSTGWREAWVFFKHEEDCAGPDLAQRFQRLFTGAGAR